MHNFIKEEMKNPRLIIKHIKELANQLYLNEVCSYSNNSTNSTLQLKIPLPTEGAFTRIHLPSFPILDQNYIQELFETERIKRELHSIDKSSPQKTSSQLPQIVPMGLPISLYNEMIGIQNTSLNSARRLEVMKKCINSIFENKIHDARKTLNAVLRALRTKHARLALCEELGNHVVGCKAVLEREQFDLVVRLMNCALQDNSDIDINEIAAAIVPLAMKFCRRLSTNVIQFAYTCIQDHPVWSNMQFWEQTFYLDVQKDIKNLYSTDSKRNIEKLYDMDISKQFSEFILKDSALEIAAQQMRLYDKLDKASIDEYIHQENDTIYAQAVHYANNVVAFRIPFDIGSKKASNSKNQNDEFDNNSVTNHSNAFDESGATQSIMNDNESFFDDDMNNCVNHSSTDIANLVIKFIFRFVDKVCNDSGIPSDYIKKFHDMIPHVVSMQIESLEPVLRESRHLPPLPKPKILIPHTLPGEEMTLNELRAYLINDGKDESRTGIVGGTQFLPAEGAIFLTNYRVIFKGRPIDPYASESIIVRSFPISTIIKEKRVNISTISSLDQYLHEGLHIKSNTFQMIKIAFDEEVLSDKIEQFRKVLQKEHAPETIYDHFAFTSQFGVSHTKQRKSKEKKTFQGKARKTLLRTVERAGFKPKNFKSKTKPYKDLNGFYTMMGPTNPKYFSDEKGNDGDNLSNSIDNLNSHSVSSMSSNMSETKSFHKLHEMLYVKDYERLGFSNYSHLYVVSVTGTKFSKMMNSQSSGFNSSFSYNDHFRISSVNIHYNISDCYPGLIVLPSKTTDEMIKKVSRCYRHNRFPAIVWKHPSTRALILRSSASNSKSMIGLFKPQSTNSNAINANSTQIFSGTNSYFDTQAEHENFIKLLSSFTLSNNKVNFLQRLSDIENSSVHSYSTNSPDSYRRHSPAISSVLNKTGGTINRAINTLRTSGGKSTIGSTMGRHLQKWSNNAIGKEYRKNTSNSSNPTQAKKNSLILESNDSLNVPVTMNSSNSSSSLNSSNFCPLYIIGEKSHLVKTHEQTCNYDFIPIEIHEVRHVKSSFKKVLKVCVPSDLKNSDNTLGSTFLKDFVGTEWLKQLQKIMEIASLIVDLVDIRCSSVILSLEEGNDLVSQIISIAELCLDPFYRTFEGFRTLIEKEWLAFGHRFTRRSNLNAASVSSGFAPVFLQFLDVVHQIHSQFPLSFEFNQYFIKFLAYHYISCRFRTFLHDCEYERCKCGWVDEDIKLNPLLKKLMTEEEEEDDDDPSDSDISLSKSNTSVMNNSSNKNSINASKSSSMVNYTGTSFWDYCVRVWAKSPIFYNFHYVPIISIEGNFTDAAVLRPLYNMPSLKIWDYYVAEEFAHGPSYDLEVMQMERHRQDEMELNQDYDKTDNRRIIVNAIYDSVDHVLPNCFIQMLDQIKLLEGELNCTSHKWFKIWNKIEIPITSDFESMQIDRHKRMRQLRSSQKIGNAPLDAMTSYSMGLLNLNYLSKVKSFSPHNFELFTSNTYTKCDFCSLLIGIRTGLKCSECDLCCHEHCKDNVAKLCQPNKKINLKPLSENTTLEDNTQIYKCDSKGIKSDSDSEIESPVEMNYDHTLTGRYQKRDSCNFKGYLFKKGALLKAWKQRWFVLDTTQHQVIISFRFSHYPNHFI